MHDVALQEPPAPPTEQRLLTEYVRTRSEQAFAELVSRYSGLVYSAALRQVRDRHLAEDVTQSAFLLLAEKAPSLPEGTVLGGWLFNAARFLSGNVVKKEARRLKHEPAAAATARYLEAQREDTFAHDVLPLLDAAMAELPDRDRDALVLRYFEHMTMAQVGHALAISSDAAEKRVARGLDKLRGLLARRGVVATAAPLVTLLTTEAVHAAPAALVQSMQAVGFTSSVAANCAATGDAGSGTAQWTLLVSPKALVGALARVIVALTGAAYVVHWSKPAPVAVVAPPTPMSPRAATALSLGNGITLPLVRIPAGGAVETPLLIGKFEVTQAHSGWP